MAVYSKNPVVRWGKRARNCLRKIVYKQLSVRTKTKRQVLFISFGGRQYSDNPKAISDCLHEVAPDVRQVWLFNDPDLFTNELPDWIEAVKRTPENQIKTLAESAVWISNFELPYFVTKRADQLYIQTYHGDRGFKKVLYEATPIRDLHLMEERNCDYFVTGSSWAEEWLPKSFKSPAKLLKVGSPRNDVLFHVDDERRQEILSELGLNSDVNILFYAPTFRDWLDGPQETYGLDLSELLDYLKTKRECDWICLVRKHPTSKGIIYNQNDSRILDVSDYSNSNNLLCVADILITDYSSIITDFILRKKPAILYIPDHDEYVSYRPLSFDYDNSPYSCARSFPELLKIIDSLDEDYGQREYEAVADYFGIYEDGNASERIAGFVEDFLNGN